MSESQFAILSSKFLKNKKNILSLIQGLQNNLKKDFLFFSRSEGSHPAISDAAQHAFEITWINLNWRYLRLWLHFILCICLTIHKPWLFFFFSLTTRTTKFTVLLFFSLLCRVKFPQCQSQRRNTLCESGARRSNEGKLRKGIVRAAVLTWPGSVPAIRSCDPLWP